VKKLISIIIPEHGVTASITDTLRFFSKANELLHAEGEDELFHVQLVGFASEMLLEDGRVCMRVDKTLDDPAQSDLIIVPAVSGDVLRAIQFNRHYFPWLSRQYKNGAEIASYCVGAFVMAATGLLNGKQCSTHWMYANEFRAFYPNTTLVDDKIITEQNGIYSSGGGISYWNLLLYLLEKYTSRRIVIAITKFFLLDIEKSSQAAFMMFKGQKEHGDELVRDVQVFIENNYKEKINIDGIAKDFAIIRRTLERRFRKATKNSIAEYIQRVRVEAAKKEIELGRRTVSEIMYEVGYSDMKTFRDLFHKITGLSVTDYRDKYSFKT